MKAGGFGEITKGLSARAELNLEKFKTAIEKYDKLIPVKSYRIEKWLGISGSEVREMVHYLRVNSFPICSGNKGYYYGTHNDVEETINHLQERRNSIDQVIIGLRKSLIERIEQENLFGDKNE